MRRKHERGMEREFAFHLEREAAEREAAGAEGAQARREAALALGRSEHWKEEARAARGWVRLEQVGRDLRLAVRGVRRAPGFALLAITILALGIGANTAVFSVVEAVLLRPLPFPQPGRLVYAWMTDTRHPGSRSTFSYPDFLDMERAQGLSAMSALAVSDLPLTGRGEAAHVRAAAVSSNLFALLGVAPAAGRGFLPGEDRPGSPGSLEGADAAVLSDHLARAKFGTAAAAVGQRLTLDSRPYRVVGVMAPGFQFPLDDHEDLWTTVAPLQVSSNGPPLTAQRGAHWMRVVGRLAPGVTLAGAQAQLNTVAAALAQQYPDTNRYQRAYLRPMLENYTASSGPILKLLLAAVGCVLLIACVNVAGLLLARAVRRRHEFALRAALGAGRSAVLRQLGCESAVLGLLGAGAGLAVAEAAIRGLVRLGPSAMVRLDQAQLSLPVLGFALGLGLATALLFGLFPAWEVARARPERQLASTLQAGGDRAGGGTPRRWRQGLVVAQFGLALAVLVAALLVLHGLQRLAGVAPGFDPDHVLTASINVPDARYPQPGDDQRFFHRLVEQVRQQPGVLTAAAAMPSPFDGNNFGVTFDWPDHPLPQPEQPSVRVGVATPGYFAALQIPLLAGRDFNQRDTHGSPEVAIVNQAFARKYLAGRQPLGARINPGFGSYVGKTPPRTIVGVTADTDQVSLGEAAAPMVFLPQAQVPLDGLDLVVRARPGAEAAVAAAVRRSVHALDAGIPVFDLAPMSQRLGTELAPARFDALLLGLFALLALTLAAVGLYATMAQAVASRQREIGVRVALGADRSRIQGMVVRDGMAMAGTGVGLGLGLAWAASHALAAALGAGLYATGALDPLAFTVAPLLLLALAWLACALPARRAAAADPLAALRGE